MADAVFTSRGGQTDYLVGLKDLVAGLSRTSLWYAFAAEEIRQRYRRSKIGIAWIIVSYIIFVAAISIFFGGFSEKGGAEFVVYVAVNYAIFTFAVGNLTDGCAVFRSNKTWISSVTVPHSVYVFKSVARSIFVLAICMIVAFVVLLATGKLGNPIALLALPAFAALFLNGILVQTYLGYMCARFRDLEYLILSLTRVLFFVTPILWVRAEMPPGSLRRTVADFNPFTHALEIFSAPMLGNMPDLLSWKIVGFITLFNFVMMLIVSHIAYRRMPYWL